MKSPLSKEINEQFARFLEDHPPLQFSMALRRMLLDYMHHEVETGFHIDFSNLLWSLNDFFELLDVAAVELQGFPSKKPSTIKRIVATKRQKKR